MITIHVLPRRIGDFLLTHYPCKLPHAPAWERGEAGAVAAPRPAERQVGKPSAAFRSEDGLSFLWCERQLRASP